MRRAAAWIVVVGVVVLVVGIPSSVRANDGFWVTLAAGVAGANNPSDYSEFWFDTPHAPPIAVTQVTGNSGNIQAATAGGTTFFTGAASLVLPTTTGYATLTNPGVANGSGGLPRFAGGTQASGAPQTATPPSDANLMSLGLGDPAANGSQVLSVGLTDPDGKPLGSGHVTIPNGGWWVIGLGAGANEVTNPNPDPTPAPNPVPGSVDPGTGGNSVTTPEPASVMLLGISGLTVAGWHRSRRRL